MTYEPKEGIDYIVDLYAVAGVQNTAEQEELKSAINERMFEYHPDRLQGLAPEFRQKGELVARLLNRARAILLDPQKRHEYDAILSEWQGPISQDGTPVITRDKLILFSLEGKTTEEIIADTVKQDEKIITLSGYSPSRLNFVEKLVQQAGENIDDELRQEYEEALLAYDRSLAIQEAERSSMLGLKDIGESNYTAGLDYVNKVSGEIESARASRVEQLQIRALGGVGVRLALLAGDTVMDVNTDSALMQQSSVELPAYYNVIAQQVQEIASQRQEVVAKRLANFMPTFPLEELQTHANEDLAVGIYVGAKNNWYGMKFDHASMNAKMQRLPEQIRAMLEADDIEGVITAGFNVLTFAHLDQVDIGEQLAEAVEKFAIKFEIGS